MGCVRMSMIEAARDSRYGIRLWQLDEWGLKLKYEPHSPQYYEVTVLLEYKGSDIDAKWHADANNGVVRIGGWFRHTHNRFSYMGGK